MRSGIEFDVLVEAQARRHRPPHDPLKIHFPTRLSASSPPSFLFKNKFYLF